MKKIHFISLIVLSFLKRYTSKLFIKLKRSPKNNIASSTSSVYSSKTVQKQSKLDSLFLPVVFIGFLASIIWVIYPRVQNNYTVSEGISGVYDNSNLPSAVTNLLSQPLVKIDKSGNPVPDIAASWKVSKDLKVYTFTLKNNLYWSDGTPVKSSEITYNIPDVNISYPDNKTIVFKLADPYSPFPSLLTNPLFKNNSLVGLGPYVVSRETYDQGTIVSGMNLEPTNPKTKLPEIVLRFYQDGQMAQTAFELGEVMSIIGNKKTYSYNNQKDIDTRSITDTGHIVTILYNLKDKVLSDQNLRYALNYATPMIKGEKIAVTSIPPSSWAYNNQIKDNLGNLAKAKASLKKVKQGKDSVITLVTTPDLKNIAEDVTANWAKAGIKSQIQIQSGIPQNFQALLINIPIPKDPDQYSLWHSTQTKTNLGKDPLAARIDKDLEDGRESADMSIRKNRYLDFQQVMAEIVPATFLYFPKTNIVYRKSESAGLNQTIPIQFSNY